MALEAEPIELVESGKIARGAVTVWRQRGAERAGGPSTAASLLQGLM